MVYVDSAVSDSVGVLTINRTDSANSIDTPTKIAITETLGEWEEDSSIRVVLIEGAGDRVFCSGGDITEIPEEDYSLRSFIETWEDLFDQMRSMGAPIVAKVDGYALGGGFDLVLHADIAIGADDARLAQPEVGLGILSHFSPPILLNTVGLKKTMWMLMTGEELTGEEASELGILSRSVPPGELDAAVEDVIDTLHSMSPRTLAKLKRGIYASAEMSPTSGREHLKQVALRSAREDPDYREGIEAELEGRDPEWPT